MANEDPDWSAYHADDPDGMNPSEIDQLLLIFVVAGVKGSNTIALDGVWGSVAQKCLENLRDATPEQAAAIRRGLRSLHYEPADNEDIFLTVTQIVEGTGTE